MAERTAIFNLKINDGNSAQKVAQNEKNLEKFRKSAKGAENSTKTFSKQLQSVNKVVDSNAFSMREANRLIQDYQSIAIAAGKDSPVGREAIQRAAELTDRMSKLRTEVRNLSNDGRALQGALQISQGVMGSYQAFQGVTAMLGVENEKLMETLVKLQAAQQVTLGLEQLRKTFEEGQASRNLINIAQTKLLTAGTWAYAAAQKGLTLAVGTSSGALKAFRVALISTGIGAIVVAIGALIANWDKLSDAVGNGSEKLKEFADNSIVLKVALAPIRLLILGITKALEALGIIENAEAKAARELASQRMREAEEMRRAERERIEERIEGLKLERKALEDTLSFEIRKRQAAGEDATELERQKMQAIIHSNKEQIKSIDELIEALEAEILLKLQSNQMAFDEIKQLNEVIAKRRELREEITKTNQDLEVFEIKLNKRRLDEGRKFAEKQADQEKARQEELQKIRDTAADLMVSSIEDEEERKRTALSLAHQREREQLIKKYGEDTELLKALEAKQFDELMVLEDELEAKADEAKKAREEQRRQEDILRLENDLMKMELNFEERLSMELALEEMRREALLASDELTNEERRKIELEHNERIAAIEQQRADRQIAADEAVKAAKQDLLHAAGSAISQFGQLAEEGSALQKAIAIGEIGAQTAMGFVRGLGIAQQAASAAGPAAPFVFPAFYASQVASVLAAANQARSILGAGGAGVSAPSTPAATAPISTDERANTRDIRQGEPTETKVVVTETDITRTQKRVTDIDVRSTF